MRVLRFLCVFVIVYHICYLAFRQNHMKQLFQVHCPMVCIMVYELVAASDFPDLIQVLQVT